MRDRLMHGTAGCCGPIDTAAPIAVAINPEGRVSVTRTDAPLGEPVRGEWHTVDVAVVNRGFVTGPLTVEAEPVGGIELDLPVHQLTGGVQESFTLGFRLTSVVVADVSLTFRALSAAGGLALHSTVHLLIRAVDGR